MTVAVASKAVTAVYYQLGAETWKKRHHQHYHHHLTNINEYHWCFRNRHHVRYELKHEKLHRTLYKYLRKSFAAQVCHHHHQHSFKTITILIQAFITCSRKGDWRLSHKAEQNGLVQGHAYTITGHHHQHQKDHHRHCPGLFRVKAGELGTVCLVRVRNPWGDKNEWKGLPSNQTPIDGQITSISCSGAWSDGDSKWKSVDHNTKKEMGLHYMYIIFIYYTWDCTTCL